MSPSYRRAIRIVTEPGRSVAEIEDDFHHFVVTVEHDGNAVTGASGQAVRYPWSTCPLAGGALGALAGLPLSTDPIAIYRFSDPLQQCTHMFEMAGLAVTQAARGLGARRYDAIVDDPEEGGLLAKLLCDGAPLLTWRLQDGVIVEPAAFAGPRPDEFRTRNLGDLPHATAEAVLVLRRAVWLAASRPMDVDRFATAADMGRPGVCYTFQPHRAAGAQRRRGSVRDFSNGPGPLARVPELPESPGPCPTS
ncbi:MAG: hypothetical protein ACJ798_05140 [Phenylobacterium sp.]